MYCKKETKKDSVRITFSLWIVFTVQNIWFITFVNLLYFLFSFSFFSIDWILLNIFILLLYLISPFILFYSSLSLSLSYYPDLVGAVAHILVNIPRVYTKRNNMLSCLLQKSFSFEHCETALRIIICWIVLDFPTIPWNRAWFCKVI